MSFWLTQRHHSLFRCAERRRPPQPRGCGPRCTRAGPCRRACSVVAALRPAGPFSHLLRLLFHLVGRLLLRRGPCSGRRWRGHRRPARSVAAAHSGTREPTVSISSPRQWHAFVDARGQRREREHRTGRLTLCLSLTTRHRRAYAATAQEMYSKDLYSILGVSSSATQDEIKAAFYKVG